MLLLAYAAPARAADPEIGIADDRIRLPGGPVADRAVAEWSAMGVDTVRIFAHWSQIAPAQRPSGFKPADPGDGHYQWFYVDNAVDRVRAAGMKVTLTVTGPGPAWTSRAPGRRQGQWKPRPAAYAAFATAVAKRYAARVNRYILWNEPNISIWLSPRGQRLRNARTVMRPLLFLRRLGCRTDGWRRMTSAACRSFKPATGAAPERRHPNADDVGLSQIRTLSATLDRLERAKAVRSTSARMPIFIDEYGYQTSPPDPIAGVRPKAQDRWLQRAAYLAWRTPRIRLFTQYLWRDEPRSANGTLSGWQSGLRFSGGRAKPSLAHFDTPFALDAANRRLWGQVRPGRAHTVTVERRPKGGAWATLAVTRTNARGYWALRRPLVLGSSYRYRAGGMVSATLRP